MPLEQMILQRLLLVSGVPEPLGNHVTLSHYVDANLLHDVVMGRSVTGILQLNNKTLMEWYFKKQGTVETATYGSEFVADRICVEQDIGLHNTSQFLGMLIKEKSYMIDENRSVVDSFIQLNAKLHKGHTTLSFHHVRETMRSLASISYQGMIFLQISKETTGHLHRSKRD
jgi:hypothetical protein